MDLSEWPASHSELHYAGRLVDNPDDHDAARNLRKLAGSAERAVKIFAQVTRICEANDLLRRGFGGGPL